MNKKGFFGTSIKGNFRKLNSKREEACVYNKLFANDNLRKIQLSKQLTEQYCHSLEQGIHGIRLETKLPLKQLSISKNSKQIVQNTSFQPESLKFSYNKQYLQNDISPLIRIRRLQSNRVSQNEKQLTIDQQCFDYLINNRIRVQSFSEERCLSPDQKKNKSRLNVYNQRNLYSESCKKQDYQSENY